MFTVSAKGIYGLTAIFELALHYNKGHMQIKQIAETHSIPQHYLEQLLVILKKAGFANSFRGTHGGYALALSPSRIKVIDVLSCLEGKLELVEGTKDNVLNFFWNSMESKIERAFDISIEDLLLQKQRHEKQIIYNI